MSTLAPDPLVDDKNLSRGKLLHYQLRIKCWDHLYECWQRHRIYLRVTSTLRTFDEQEALFALGRTKPGKKVTNVSAGKSWHNYGLAYDVVILDKFGNPNWDTEHSDWSKVGMTGEFLGLTWGAHFKRLVDYVHFEFHPNIPTIQQALKLYNKGGIPNVHLAAETKTKEVNV
jgi:hypothetical protein